LAGYCEPVSFSAGQWGGWNAVNTAIDGYSLSVLANYRVSAKYSAFHLPTPAITTAVGEADNALHVSFIFAN
jgi:hypothetical protein